MHLVGHTVDSHKIGLGALGAHRVEEKGHENTIDIDYHTGIVVEVEIVKIAEDADLAIHAMRFQEFADRTYFRKCDHD